ncbi:MULTISPECIES: DUF5667 domain-containing protein [unclassified Aeromicrobium]|jgi:hypothetical protein|uniref:DUF5667 domain-containing protein n=1 Tax=unclassified Aeromicrobium TaxID=2633570 RepID=UPI000A7E56BF|nr:MULTISPECIES: DUF5667 domain-containing protein [unclassified Aeromicrobium]
MIRRPGRDDAQDFHDAWESGAHGTGQVAELVRTAQTLRASATVAPRPEFASALRERLMTEGQTVLVPAPGASRRTADAAAGAPAAAPSRARRRLATAAVAAVSSLGVVGLVAGSASALPGDVLYPVKRTVEDVELALHRSDEARGTQRLELATERLREVRAVIADGSPAARGQVPALLDEFSTQAEQGSASLFDAYDTDGSTASIETVNDFAAASAVDLTTIAADVPADASESFSAAAAAVTDLAGQAGRLCASCGTADLGSLVGVVRSVLAPADSDSGSRREASAGRSSAAPSPSTAGGSAAPSTITPSTTPPLVQVPTVPAPSPTATPRKGLGTVTDPLLGGLLGDDDQEGLVPGLLGGLLGPKK